jgi:hypothetical protein
VFAKQYRRSAGSCLALLAVDFVLVVFVVVPIVVVVISAGGVGVKPNQASRSRVSVAARALIASRRGPSATSSSSR